MSRKLFVGGLPWSVSDEDLYSVFARFGQINEARVIFDRDTGRSRGFGFVTFENDNDANDAVTALNDSDLMGRRIKVNEAISRDNNRNGGNGGGGSRNSVRGYSADEWRGNNQERKNLYR
jgi:RNA recognition motif-containing protein